MSRLYNEIRYTVYILYSLLKEKKEENVGEIKEVEISEEDILNIPKLIDLDYDSY